MLVKTNIQFWNLNFLSAILSRLFILFINYISRDKNTFVESFETGIVTKTGLKSSSSAMQSNFMTFYNDSNEFFECLTASICLEKI